MAGTTTTSQLSTAASAPATSARSHWWGRCGQRRLSAGSTTRRVVVEVVIASIVRQRRPGSGLPGRRVDSLPAGGGPARGWQPTRHPAADSILPLSARAPGARIGGTGIEPAGVGTAGERPGWGRRDGYRTGRGGARSGGECLLDQVGGAAGGLAHPHADGLEGLLLGLRGARGAGDDGTGVAHGLALRGGEARHVPEDGLGDVLLDVLRSALLGVTADLTDHHDRLGLRVLLEGLQRVDVGGADDRVAADADGGGETDLAQFVHPLVGQGTGF